MGERKKARLYRIPLKSVGIRETAKNRLYEYLGSFDDPPVASNIVTLAVIEYIDRHPAPKRVRKAASE